MILERQCHTPTLRRRLHFPPSIRHTHYPLFAPFSSLFRSSQKFLFSVSGYICNDSNVRYNSFFFHRPKCPFVAVPYVRRRPKLKGDKNNSSESNKCPASLRQATNHKEDEKIKQEKEIQWTIFNFGDIGFVNLRLFVCFVDLANAFMYYSPHT